MTRVQILLKGRPGVHRGLICWRGKLPDDVRSWLGVALDKPLGHHDGERRGIRFFSCEPKHGVFVEASRARVEVATVGKDPMDAGFDLSESETDGEGSFGMSDNESDDGAAATGAPNAAAAYGVKKTGGWGSVTEDPQLRLALAIQNVYRGKASRADTEDAQLKEGFTMPPKTSSGQTIEELVGDDGEYPTTLSLGHDSDAATGAWTLTLHVAEPIIIHHVAFDVGNDPKNPAFFKTDFDAPFQAVMPSGVLRNGDKLLVQGRTAVRLGGNGQPATARSGKPAEPLKRLDNAHYARPQTVTLYHLTARAGEVIDLRNNGVPPLDAKLLNPQRLHGLGKRGEQLKARVVVHFHKYFDAPPMDLTHTIRFDGHGSASQHSVMLYDPDHRKGQAQTLRRPKGGPRSTAGYLMAVRAAIKLQRQWRGTKGRRDDYVAAAASEQLVSGGGVADVMHPTAVYPPGTPAYPRGNQPARAIQAQARGQEARRSAAEQRRAARELGLESWTTLEQRLEPSDTQLRQSMVVSGDVDGRTRLLMYDELQETLPEAEARRAYRQRQHEQALQRRALQRERDGVNRVMCRPNAPGTSQGGAAAHGGYGAACAGETTASRQRAAAEASRAAEAAFYADDAENRDGQYSIHPAAYDGAYSYAGGHPGAYPGNYPGGFPEGAPPAFPHGYAPPPPVGMPAAGVVAVTQCSPRRAPQQGQMGTQVSPGRLREAEQEQMRHATVIQKHQRRRGSLKTKEKEVAQARARQETLRREHETRAARERAEEEELMALMHRQQAQQVQQYEQQQGRAATMIQARQRRNSAVQIAQADLVARMQQSADSHRAAAALGLSEKLGAVIVRCIKRWRSRMIANRIAGAAMMRAAALGAPTRADAVRAERYRAMRHAPDFLRLVDEQLKPHEHEKRSAVEREDFDVAKAAKAVEAAVRALLEELAHVEDAKSAAVEDERYSEAADAKQQTDSIRTQIALHLYRAPSAFFHALPPPPAGAEPLGDANRPPDHSAHHSAVPTPTRPSHPGRSPGRFDSPSRVEPDHGGGSSSSAAADMHEDSYGAVHGAYAQHLRFGFGTRDLEIAQPVAYDSSVVPAAGVAHAGQRRAQREQRRMGGATSRAAMGGVSMPRAGPPKKAWAPTASREALAMQLQTARREESVLQAELVALRTRRRQREGRTLAASKLSASTASNPSATRLVSELAKLQRQREIIAEKTRELQATRLRVRPKDIITLQRARALVNPHNADLDAEATNAEEEAVDAAQAGVDRLRARQRELLQSSQRERMHLERELIEERILRDELAAEAET